VVGEVAQVSSSRASLVNLPLIVRLARLVAIRSRGLQPFVYLRHLTNIVNKAPPAHLGEMSWKSLRQ
jgi:hypothetical protein